MNEKSNDDLFVYNNTIGASFQKFKRVNVVKVSFYISSIVSTKLAVQNHRKVLVVDRAEFVLRHDVDSRPRRSEVEFDRHLRPKESAFEGVDVLRNQFGSVPQLRRGCATKRNSSHSTYSPLPEPTCHPSASHAWQPREA